MAWFDEVKIRHASPDKAGMERVPEAPMNQNEFIDDDWLKQLRE